MILAAKIYFIVFGVLTIIGGLIGYLKAGSTISMVAGGISGLLLLLAAFLIPSQPTAGLVIALVISILLAAQFVPKLFRGGKFMPAGMMSILSVIGIVFAVAAWMRK